MSVTGSDDSDSDATADVETNNISTQDTDTSKSATSPTSLNTDVKYNSVYHNAGMQLIGHLTVLLIHTWP